MVADDDLAAELERLRAENAALREQLAAPGATRPANRGWRRRWLSITCAVLAAVLLPLAVLTVWARNTMLDTDQYVETVAPLAENADVQEAVSFRVTEAVAEAVDFRGIAEDALAEIGPRAEILAGPIESGAKNLINQIVGGLVSSEQFARLWEDANRVGHENLVLVLTGEGNESVETSDGRVVLKLGPLAEQVVGRLDEILGTELADSIPAERLSAEFVLVESDDLDNIQGLVRLFDNLTWFTAVFALVFLAGTVVFAEDRRLGVRRLGIALVVPMVIALLAYAWVRSRYLGALPEDVHNPDAAAAIFDIVTRFVHRALRALLVLGVLALLGAWVVGPSSLAARVRSWWDALVGRAGEAGEGREVGAVPIWVAAHERTLMIAVAVLGGLALVLWTRPTGMVVLVLVILVLVAMGAIRLVATVARRAQTAPASAPSHEAPTTGDVSVESDEQPADAP